MLYGFPTPSTRLSIAVFEHAIHPSAFCSMSQRRGRLLEPSHSTRYRLVIAHCLGHEAAASHVNQVLRDVFLGSKLSANPHPPASAGGHFPPSEEMRAVFEDVLCPLEKRPLVRSGLREETKTCLRGFVHMQAERSLLVASSSDCYGLEAEGAVGSRPSVARPYGLVFFS